MLPGSSDAEQFAGVGLEQLLALTFVKPLDVRDQQVDIVDPASGRGVAHRSGTRFLGAEQASVNSDGPEQQLDGVLGVEARVVEDLPHLVFVGGAGPERARTEPSALVRNGPAAVGHNDLQAGEIVEDLGGQQRGDRQRLLLDEVQGVGFPGRGRHPAE